jgi:tetratricopeptide (TPR) repeat protein/TolB-like protein
VRLLRLGVVLLSLLVALSGTGAAQGAAAAGRTLVVVPFENQSQSPGLEWIGEAFPEILEERLNSPNLYVVPREDRVRAYDRVGIPNGIHPTRATLYRMAEQMDVDYVVLGSYSFDGRMFTTTAQVLDLGHTRLLPAVTESGPLLELIDVQTALAWDVMHSLQPELTIAREAFKATAPPVRLDAFENYVRGIVAPSAPEQIRRLREAVRLNPDYPEALLRLGMTYFHERQYDQAVSWLGRVPVSDPHATQANFYLGLAACSQGDYDRAESAFNLVASRLPLTEVYNNLGVVAARRGKKNAAEYFQKASDADPNDPDYHFNLGVAFYRTGDLAGASRQLRVTLGLTPGDADAKSLLETISADASAKAEQKAVSTNSKTPVERLRRNYDESSFRQLALKIDATAEQRLAQTDPRTHAQYHGDRGRDLLAQGFVAEAEREFREALGLDASNAASHAGLARVLELRGDSSGARLEAEAALRLQQFAEPLLVLVRLDLRDNRAEQAAENVNRALRLEPSNAQAQALKRTVAAKLAEK